MISTTASMVLASSLTKFVLEENLRSNEGIWQSLFLGGNIMGICLMKKAW